MNKKVNRSFYLQFGKGEINGYVVKAEKLENSLEELYDWRTDVLRLADFDYIIIETVGVGQSEIDIAGLADVTVVT